MCDQTEVCYNEGEVVWVKLGPLWWPGMVKDYDKLPEEITANLRKRPIAVVKFFQEDSFEYVKNLNHIYHYNCRRKTDFIKKGLDMLRSSGDVPSNMKMFPNDVATAEHLTGGNPNILQEDEFAPEEKRSYSEIFGSCKKSPSKRGQTDSVKKEYVSWRAKSLTTPIVSSPRQKNGKKSLPSTSELFRPITHPRFINKALKGISDHEIRIRTQATPSKEDLATLSPVKHYNCHMCGFQSTRLNVIVLHNKSHTGGYAQTSVSSDKKTGRMKERASTSGLDRLKNKSPKRDNKPVDTTRKKISVEEEAKVVCSLLPENKETEATPKLSPVKDSAQELVQCKKSLFGRKKRKGDRAEKFAQQKIENEQIRETLLKDWDDEEDKVEEEREKEEMVKLKQRTEEGDENMKSKDMYKVGDIKEKSCFDFDDSDDTLELGETVMKFGMKLPRLKLEEKTKRPLSDDSTEEEKIPEGRMDDTPVENEKTEANVKEEIVLSVVKHEDENGVLDTAFETLLAETSVPNIPDIPNALVPSERILEGVISNNSESYNSSLIQVDNQVYETAVQSEEISIAPNTCASPSADESTISPCGNENSIASCAEDIVVHSCVDERVESGLETETCNNDIPKTFLDEPLVQVTAKEEILLLQNDPTELEEHDVPTYSSQEVEDVKEEIECEQVCTIKNEMLGEVVCEEVIAQIHEEKNIQQQPLREMDFDINSMPFVGDGFMETEVEPTPSIIKPQTMTFTQYRQAVGQSKKTGPTTTTTTSLVEMLPRKKQILVKQQQSSPFMNQCQVEERKPDIMTPQRRYISAKRGGKVVQQKIVIPKPTPNSPAIKVNTSIITNMNTVPLVPQKGASGSGQVFILQKSELPHLIQLADGKMLLQTSSQGTSQGKFVSSLSPQQQRALTVSGKFTPTGRTKMIIGKTQGSACKSATQCGTQITHCTESPTVLSKSSVVSAPSKPTTSKIQKIVINNQGVITACPKNLMISKGGTLSPINTGTIVTKGQTLLPQSILTTNKSGKLTAISSQGTSGSKAQTIYSRSNKGQQVIAHLAPITNKGAVISGNQNLTLVTSKPGSSGATRVVLQNSSSKQVQKLNCPQQTLKVVKKPTASTSSFLIQTSQGLMTIPTSQAATLAKFTGKSIKLSIPQVSQQHTFTSPRVTVSVPAITQSIIQSPQTNISKKVIVHNVRPSNHNTPNILQKTQRKTTGQRALQKAMLPQTTASAIPSAMAKAVQSSAIVPVVTSQETLVASSTEAFAQQTVSIAQEGSCGPMLFLDEHGNYHQLSDTNMLSFDTNIGGDASQALYMDSMFIIDSGNVVRVAQTPSTTTYAHTTPSHDILAKALANTQVLDAQPEFVVPDMLSSTATSIERTTSSFDQQGQYPPTLSHTVLETSLTLNQPIMTPLEVPSAVTSSGLSHMTSLTSNFISGSSLLNAKSNMPTIPPSMPLLSDDEPHPVLMSEPIYMAHVPGSETTPTTSEHLTYQLTLDENNSIVSSAQSMTSYEPESSHIVLQYHQQSVADKPEQEYDTKSDNLATACLDSVDLSEEKHKLDIPEVVDDVKFVVHQEPYISYVETDNFVSDAKAVDDSSRADSMIGVGTTSFVLDNSSERNQEPSSVNHDGYFNKITTNEITPVVDEIHEELCESHVDAVNESFIMKENVQDLKEEFVESEVELSESGLIESASFDIRENSKVCYDHDMNKMKNNANYKHVEEANEVSNPEKQPECDSASNGELGFGLRSQLDDNSSNLEMYEEKLEFVSDEERQSQNNQKRCLQDVQDISEDSPKKCKLEDER